MAYWSQSDLEARLSAATVKAIFDDDNDGVADAAAIARLQSDADNKVNSYLQGTYDMATITASPPAEVKRLSLDVAVAFAAQRHGEFVRKDWAALMKQAEAELDRLRTGKTSLGIDTAPEPAANQGAQLLSQVPDEDPPAKIFVGGMGDF